jgi:hypothetical protein
MVAVIARRDPEPAGPLPDRRRRSDRIVPDEPFPFDHLTLAEVREYRGLVALLHEHKLTGHQRLRLAALQRRRHRPQSAVPAP